MLTLQNLVKKSSIVAAISLAFALAACGGQPEPAKAPERDGKAAGKAPAPDPNAPKWTATEGIDTPESVYLDTDSGFLFVSNVVGMPDQKDGSGRISKLNTDGKVLEANWVTGLNAPKGLRSYKGTLWVTDIDEVVSIDIATAKAGPHIKIANAKFLNDTAVGPDGTVYVSDMLDTKIYAIKDGKATVFAQGEDIEYPNGLLVDGDLLIVGGWGKPTEGFTTKVPGRLFALDLKTKKKTLITPEPIANIDGVESDGNSGYIISDWLAGKILRVSPTLHPQGSAVVTPVREFMQGTADIAYIPGTHTLIVPHMNENKIAAYDITERVK